VQSYVVGAAEDAPGYGYMASHVIRRATAEEVKAWRELAWAAAEEEL